MATIEKVDPGIFKITMDPYSEFTEQDTYPIFAKHDTPHLKVIYIAGPYRADTEWGVVQNIRKAEQAALFVWRCGGVALCPHKNTALFGGALPDDVWLRGDLELLSRCDAVWMVGEWGESAGAQAELRYAFEHGIPVLYDEEQVQTWLLR